MKPWTTWTATCLILCSIGFMPLNTSAIDNLVGTSLTQGQVKEPSKPASPAPELTSQTSFDATINQFQATLGKEKGFEDWQQAKWNSYPLGPGTHGWVIILSNQGQDVGYMIVHSADNGGYRLTEYGTGPSPLFSLGTLYRSLIQQELIPTTTSYADFVQNETIIEDRIYMDTLTSIWKIKLDDDTYHYLDAKSGELLPLTEDPTPQLTDELVRATHLSQDALTVMRPAFDPYERLPWIEGTPLPVTSLPELQVALEQQGNLTYVTELYGDQVTMPLAVLGYQEWLLGDNYLILEHEGPRYVLMDSSLGQGDIYP
jgi:hypothetical protein